MTAFATAAEYETWFKQECAEGNPPDALRPNAGPEDERFFARTIPGPDGHTYWYSTTHMRFRLDSGGERNARWWWFERVNGQQGRGRLGSICGERHCITPEHQQFVSWAEARQRFSDQHLIGAVQVVAMRLGRTPTAVDYKARRKEPSAQIISMRFGGWDAAMRSAGLEPSPLSLHKRGPEDCIAALQYLARYLGHIPSGAEYRRNSRVLREAGLPPSASTIRVHLGEWQTALRKAGLA